MTTMTRTQWNAVPTDDRVRREDGTTWWLRREAATGATVLEQIQVTP